MSALDIKSMLISTAGFSAGIAMGVGFLNMIWKIVGPIMMRLFFGSPWIYDGNNGSLNQADDLSGTSGAGESVSSLTNRLNTLASLPTALPIGQTFGQTMNPNALSENTLRTISSDQPNVKKNINIPQSSKQLTSSPHGAITFGSFKDYDEKFYYVRIYNSETKITVFLIFWKTPNRSIMKRFVENYKISHNRNVIDGHITSEKFVVNVEDTTFTNPYFRSGRVENINSENIIGTQHGKILSTVTNMYSSIDRYTASGFTVRRVFCLLKNNSGTSADDIIEMIANESGLDLYYHQINTSAVPYTASMGPVQIPMNLSSFYPRDNAVTVYRYSDVKNFISVACTTNSVCDIDDKSVIDHLVTCNPSNSIIFIVCDNKTDYDAIRSNSAVDLWTEIKNQIDEIQDDFDISVTKPNAFELASARVILRFLDIWIDNIPGFLAINREKYLKFLSDHSISQANALTDMNLIIVQLIRAWKLDNEITTCRDIIGRCRFISVDVENRLFNKLS